jgi:outer membrane protein TolC
MKGILQVFFLTSLIAYGCMPARGVAAEAWAAPFDRSGLNRKVHDTALTLTDVLALVAARNPAFKALSLQEQAAFHRLEQAALRPNPELEAEFEEVAWDAPGFSESEITVTLSQEFELFGQRGARKKLAHASIEATQLQIKLSAYDLYLETKRRFYAFAHARERLELTRKSVELADGILEQDDELIEGFDLPLELDAIDEIDGYRDVLSAERVQKRVM